MEKVNYKIREITVNDASQWCELLIQIDEESDNLLFEKGERDKNITKCVDFIQKTSSSKKAKIIIAENLDGKLIGYICGQVPPYNKKSHVMELSTGVIKGYQHGLGFSLFRELMKIVIDSGITRLECQVIETNKICINALKKVGFQLEGIKKASIKINNKLINECILGKQL